jgi:WD40 repeat protein
VYDVNTSDCVLEVKDAHEAEVNCVIPLYEGTKLVSCSADSSIRLWTTSQKVSFTRKKKDEEKLKRAKVPYLCNIFILRIAITEV